MVAASRDQEHTTSPLLSGAQMPLPVEFKPPQHPGGSHCFLSHMWSHGQDQVATVKAMLGNMAPSLEVWLE